MPNMAQAVSHHNTELLNEEQNQFEDPVCNCRGGVQNCPVDGKCRVEGVIYKAKITEESTGVEKYYIGMTGRTFKLRWGEHKTHFKKNPGKQNRTAYDPSLYTHTHIWDLQDKGEAYNIQL